MPTRPRRGLLAVLALMLCAALVAITWVVTSGEDTERSTDSASRPPPTTSQSDTAPGPPAGQVPVTVVKIDNVESARPQSGLDTADVVYVEPVEGGYTRLAAVYAAEVPEVAGPVRSARETDVELLAQYGNPSLVFSGAAPEIEPVLVESDVRLVRHSDHPDAFYREPARPSPHNLYARLSLLPRVDGPRPEQVLPRGDAPSDGRPTAEHTVAYEHERYGFTWSPELRRWRASLDGEPLTSVGVGLVSTATVVVQRVDIVADEDVRDAAGTPSPVARTVGTGPATVLRDGRAFEGTWSRPSAEEGTRFTTESGQPLPLADGPVWVLLVPR
ncbi:DUF3048 domain-containing protein [Saccharomonospora sp.]|uniref:DUF3048 domain-containing protein n=1 Tax=Saccharomonospora sp. TaxID=33913 RepID=UPI002636E4BB|nr:DUF3048 domain-containing protein [Saccharomonospora sp.]